MSCVSSSTAGAGKTGGGNGEQQQGAVQQGEGGQRRSERVGQDPGVKAPPGSGVVSGSGQRDTVMSILWHQYD